MSSDSKQVIGIDFGTSNSYFCKFLTKSDGHKTRTIDFGNDQVGSISSTIMYRPKKSNLIGTIAEQEWGESSNKEKKSYKLRTHFKPDILVDSDAKQYSVDFLQTIVTQLRATRIDFFPDKHKVIMGVPAQASEDYKKTLTSIAKESGYGNIQLLPEPVGALIYHLWNKDLSARQTQGGILVVDFGGGTCDFTYMQHLDVCKAWGDMSLGGRLFDDLFYQWFLDQNPEAEQKLQKEGDEYYVHWVLCKKVKEFFSNSMTLNKTESLKWKVGEIKHYGAFNNLTWEEFTKRAEKYSPHKSFIDYLNNTKQKSNVISNKNSIDLINWFKESLISGLDQNKIRSSDIERVILTGGSSQWPFVEDTISEVLHIDKDNLLMSGNPKAAIGEGLVMLPYLKSKLDNIINLLRDNTEEFITNNISPEIGTRISSIQSKIIKDISANFYSDKIQNILTSFGKNGGSLASLKEKVQVEAYAYEPVFKNLFEKEINTLRYGLEEKLHNSINDWFVNNGITYTGKKVNISEIRDSIDSKTISQQSEKMELNIDNMATIITSSLVAILVGGALWGSYFFLIPEIIAGIVLTILIGIVGKKKALKYTNNIKIPKIITKAVFNKTTISLMINKSIKKHKKEIEKEFSKILEKPLIEINANLKIAIEKEIDSLSVINQL